LSRVSKWSPAVPVGAALVLLALSLFACGPAAETAETEALPAEDATTSSAPRPPTTAPPQNTTTTAAQTGTTATAAWGPWQPVDLPGLPPVLQACLAGDDLLMRTDSSNELLRRSFDTGQSEVLPREGIVVGMAADGPLAAWSELTGEYPDQVTTVYSYDLLGGKKTRIFEREGSVNGPRIDGGRLFWGLPQRERGDSDQGETEYSSHAIWMQALDESGRPVGQPKQVTGRPNSSHEPGGDEMWSFDVEGRYLVYQRDWGDDPGIHLLDLESGEETYLGPGDIPSVSDSLVAWRARGEADWDVWGFDLASRRVVRLAEGFMPYAGPGYLAYVKRGAGEGDREEVVLLDETTGMSTVLGERRARDAYDYVSLTGNERSFAFVGEESPEGGEVRLFVRSAATSDAPKADAVDLWKDATPPPAKTD
jgi:hypothetical protein